jgi:hypothetical protein
MRKILVAFVLSLAAAAAYASQPPQSVAPDKLLAATKKLAAKDCRPRNSFGTGMYVSHCVYSPPAFIDGEWNVMVHFVLVDKNGKHIGAMGTDAVYLFNRAGKFISVLPGM